MDAIEFDLAAQLEALANSREPMVSHRSLELPDLDDVDEVVDDDAGYAEGQHFMIEYVDSAGNFSRRRITVWNIGLNVLGIPILTARCHERGAIRQFRADRIGCCISADGEVFDDVPAFLHENFGTSQTVAGWTSGDEALQDWERIRRIINPEAVLMAAMARADLVMRRVELDEVVDFLAISAEREDAWCDETQCARIRRLIVGMRPRARGIEAAISRIQGRPANRQRAFLIALGRVMDADGHRDAREIALLDHVCRVTTGVGLPGLDS